MRHAAHQAANNSRQYIRTSRSLFSSGSGAHSAKAVRMAQMTQSNGAVLGLDQAVVERLNEVAPQTRRALREAARAAERRSHILTSASLAALVGTAATAVALAGPDDIKGSILADTAQISSEGEWQATGDASQLDVNQMSRSLANNPQVAALMDQDYNVLPAGFNPNHATGDSGNAYSFSQCTWWVYVRRHELGLPVGSYMGNGNMWANSARALGYWVDNTPRHVGDIMVFAAGQAGADGYYGHVAIVEQINPDGSIVTSECGASMNGKTYSKTYTNPSDFQFIHY